MRLRWSSVARADIVEIIDFIRRDNPRAALRFVNALKHTVAPLVDYPELGGELNFGKPHLRGLRYRAVRRFPRYSVFCRHTDDTIEIVRVLHSARDIISLFDA